MQQAAKSFVGQMTTVGFAGAGKLFKLVSRKAKARGIDLTNKPDEVAAQFLAWAEVDPNWVAEVFQALLDSDLNSLADPLANVDPAPKPYVNQENLRNHVRDNLDAIHLLRGPAGCGKTATAQKIAEDLAETFPRYRCYLDLNAFRVAGALLWDEIFRRVLVQSGVPLKQLTDGEAQLEQQYRNMIAGKRMLLIIDNVHTAAELGRLAPGWSNILVIATAQVVTVDMEAKYPSVPLDRLSTTDARELLASRPGLREMIERELDATDTLLEWFDNLPAAIAEIGALLAGRRDEPEAIGDLLAEFQSAGVTSLAALTTRRLAATVELLPTDAAAAFSSLAALPASDFTMDVAPHLFDIEWPRSVLDALANAGLLTKIGLRYRLPHYIRNYARATAVAVDVDAAEERIFDYYVTTSVAVDLAHAPHRLRRSLVPEPKPVWSGDKKHMKTWLDDNREALAAFAERAYRAERYDQLWQLCTALEHLILSTKRYDLCLEVFQWGVTAARTKRRTNLLARLLANQGRIYAFKHSFVKADALLNEAAALVQDDLELTSSIEENIARRHETQGDATLDPTARDAHFRRAIEHLKRSVEIDLELIQRATNPDELADARRAYGIHARMLANVEVKLGSAEATEALRRLAGLEDYFPDEERNQSRVHSVRAKAYAVLRDLALAQIELDEARRLAEQSRSIANYEDELDDIQAEIAWRAEDYVTARKIWGRLLREAGAAHHPNETIYQDKINQLPPVEPR